MNRCYEYKYGWLLYLLKIEEYSKKLRDVKFGYY